MKEELAARVRVPFDYIKLQRKLKQKVIAIHVSMDNPWTIDPSILQASLFESVSPSIFKHNLAQKF